MTLAVPPHAVDAYRTLLDELSVLAQEPPCASMPEAWMDDDAETEDRDLASRACLGCPAMTACAAYADTARERAGVWGGVSRWPRRGRPAASTAA